MAIAPTIDFTLDTANGATEKVRLERAPGQPEAVTLPPFGFGWLLYRFTLPVGTGPGLLALTLPGAQVVAIVYFGRRIRGAEAAPTASAPAFFPTASTAPPRPTAEERGRSGFLANLSSYEPIYAVCGPGTDTDARLQVSFKYQFFALPSMDHGRTASPSPTRS